MKLSNLILATSLIIGQTQIHEDTRAQLLRVYTDLPKESGWWVVPRGVSKMTIHAEAQNTETVLFWLVPTGTATWSERELIGYDKDGNDGWSVTWALRRTIVGEFAIWQLLFSIEVTGRLVRKQRTSDDLTAFPHHTA